VDFIDDDGGEYVDFIDDDDGGKYVDFIDNDGGEYVNFIDDDDGGKFRRRPRNTMPQCPWCRCLGTFPRDTLLYFWY
jgi:glycosyltransferase involved in cell wall biosynthesis